MDFQMMTLSVQLWGVFFCLIIAVCLVAGSRTGGERYASLVVLSLCTGTHMLCEVLSAVYSGHTGQLPTFVMHACHFLLLCTVCIAMFIYQRYLIHSFTGSPPHLALQIVSYVLSLVGIILVGVSLFNGLLYRLEFNIYYQSAYFFIFQIPLFVCVILDLIWLIRRRKILKPLWMGTGIAYLVLIVTAGLVDIFLPYSIVPSLLLCLGNMLLFTDAMLSLPEHMQKQTDSPAGKGYWRDLQRDIILTQLKSYFLSSTMSTIYALCATDLSRGRTALAGLSDYLQLVITSADNEELTPFPTELELVETYFSLEQLRNPDKLHLETEIRCKSFSLPALCIQPLVENAVRHGIGHRERGGTVWLSTDETSSEYIITVRDNGVGLDPYTSRIDDPKHTGIRNTRERLSLLCKGTLDIHSKPGAGAEAVIHIPKGAFTSRTRRRPNQPPGSAPTRPLTPPRQYSGSSPSNPYNSRR